MILSTINGLSGPKIIGLSNQKDLKLQRKETKLIKQKKKGNVRRVQKKGLEMNVTILDISQLFSLSIAVKV
ncbi:hypothetical protein Ahy_A08g039840 isoform G [Arachis hypogaea]|uniref:Uncharacterized protein n=1 Tax=Arachis hypogaea TaxID=3818 RepID=A0A445BXF2_ARAHY|nr:hypothetical protein Ahy_A08g039840 isoform G [Arachis hypogaea]